jgi:hypothetical protein
MRAANCQVLLVIACLLTAAACSHRADDCRNTLTCGNVDAGSGGSSKDSGSPDASVCGAPCSSTTHCDATLKRCIECTSNSNCKTPTTLCETDAGICIQCTVANEATCGGNSCNPGTNACTNTPRGTLDYCHACVADSECTGGNQTNPTARCVPMNFGTTLRGNYCLPIGTTVGSCTRPFGVLKAPAESASGAAAQNYCGINESTTTCEAVQDLIGLKGCSSSDQCGCINGTNCAGGTCPTTGTMANTCTISCSLPAQCPATLICPSSTPFCQ